MFQIGHYGEAEDFFRKVIDLDPSIAAAWSNLGLTYQTNGLRDAAMKCYLHALALEPLQFEALKNMGFITQADGHLEAAAAIFKKALTVVPDDAQALSNLGITYLMQRNFAEGWPLWEHHYRMEKTPDIKLPMWDLARCQRLALWKEMGLGDEILFATLLPELIGRNQEFVVEMDDRLIPAFARSFPQHLFVPRRPKDARHVEPGRVYSDEAFLQCDAQAPMGMLAGAFRRTPESFMAQPHRLLIPSRAAVAERIAKRMIGISWRSFLPAKGTYTQLRKSSKLDHFAPLSTLPETMLVNLQYGDVGQEIMDAGFDVADPVFDKFWDIEALLDMIAECDVIVTTCCVTAHFAGALGKPTYVMHLGNVPPLWSWTKNESSEALGARSYWYPSCRIVTAPTWDEAIEEVRLKIEGRPS